MHKVRYESAPRVEGLARGASVLQEIATARRWATAAVPTRTPSPRPPEPGSPPSAGWNEAFAGLDVLTMRMYTGCVRFAWDERKNEVNIRKHGLDFADVSEIFDAPMLVRLDNRKDYGEDRWIGVGSTHGRIVVVVFTLRDNGETIRIISLRKARKNEREGYERAIAH